MTIKPRQGDMRVRAVFVVLAQEGQLALNGTQPHEISLNSDIHLAQLD